MEELLAEIEIIDIKIEQIDLQMKQLLKENKVAALSFENELNAIPNIDFTAINDYKLYICPIINCRKRLTSHTYLSKHLTNHVNKGVNKKLCCSICNKRFSTISNRKAHERRHKKR